MGDDHLRPGGARLRLNNIALAVRDLESAVRWYHTAFGFVVGERGRFEAINADFAMLDGAGVRLELVSRPSVPSTPVDRTEPPNHLNVLGWKALVLESDDLLATTVHLKACGADIVWANQPLTEALSSTLVRDHEGNLVNVFGAAQVQPSSSIPSALERH